MLTRNTTIIWPVPGYIEMLVLLLLFVVSIWIDNKSVNGQFTMYKPCHFANIYNFINCCSCVTYIYISMGIDWLNVMRTFHAIGILFKKKNRIQVHSHTRRGTLTTTIVCNMGKKLTIRWLIDLSSIDHKKHLCSAQNTHRIKRNSLFVYLRLRIYWALVNFFRSFACFYFM